MALGTTLQYTESNLIGTLYAPITSSATSAQVQFTDKVTGAARTPDANTKLFVIDKGSENAPNPNYEIVLAASHSTTGGITTLTGLTRGLAFTGYSLAAVTANQKAHTAGAVIGCVDVHFMWNTLVSTLKGTGDSMVVTTFATEAALASDVPSPTNGQVAYVTGLNSFLFRNNGKWWGTPLLVFADDTARDASITSPSNGMKIYNTAAGAFQGYVAGSWTNEGTSTTPNMSLTVAGKGEEATAAEIIANTQTGGTGADLIVNPKYLSDASVTTSAGAGDAGKYVRANSSGLIDYTLLPRNLFTGTAGETLAPGDWISRKTSDGKLYKADYSTVEKATVIGVIYTGGAADATVYYQGNGSKFITTGLTAGSEYYLSATPGQITTTVPVFNSGSVIPVKIGYASSTTELDMQIQRLPRRVVFKNTENSGTQFVVTTTGAAQTITCGFNIDRVEINHFGYMRNVTFPSAGFGKYVPSESLQICSYYSFSGGVFAAGYFGNVNYIMYMSESAGATACSATATVDGSNNVVITWTNVSSMTAFVNYNGIVYERL